MLGDLTHVPRRKYTRRRDTCRCHWKAGNTPDIISVTNCENEPQTVSGWYIITDSETTSFVPFTAIISHGIVTTGHNTTWYLWLPQTPSALYHLPALSSIEKEATLHEKYWAPRGMTNMESPYPVDLTILKSINYNIAWRVHNSEKCNVHWTAICIVGNIQ